VNIEQGKYWLEKAVYCGHPAASYQLGKRLLYGLDYPQDETAAMTLLESAAQKDYTLAELLLKKSLQREN
jgi:TPR repeat protein